MALQGLAAQFREWTPEEVAILRERYPTTEAEEMARILDRSKTAVYRKATVLGLNLKRRKWTRADDNLLRFGWGEKGLNAIAKELGRTALTVYHRARQLGLASGCPEGYEYLTHAAERTGYDTGQLRVILLAHGAQLRRSLANPWSRKPGKATHYVDPLDVDEAVAAWHRTEVVHAAARARGLCSETLGRWLREAGIAKTTPKKFRWRVPTDVIDRVVAERRPGMGRWPKARAA